MNSQLLSGGNVQYLLTLPQSMALSFEEVEKKPRPKWFAISDPANGNIGSGGATCRVLINAHRQLGNDCDFFEWLKTSQKL
ncbi:MAG TPA: hypothetical protein PLW02_08385, partial [Verrucomicrobiota bacterium]|nr:hypothetical protein [Verrucomicrobiota bacterium]